MKKQIWFCLVCKTCGEVEYESGCGILWVAQLISAQHKKHSALVSSSFRTLRNEPLPCDADPQIVAHQ